MSIVGWVLALAFGVVLIAWIMMRTLLLPRLGCWLFYVFMLVALFCVLVTGLLAVGATALIEHVFKDVADSDKALLISLAAFALMGVGKLLLKARDKRPFQAIMRWFIRHSFENRVGATLPTGVSADHPCRLAFRAAFDDNYADRR